MKQKWESGISFSDAAFYFATEREQEGIRTAVDKGAWITRMLLVQMSLFARLQAGELIAIGIREGGGHPDDPQLIPAHLFNDEKWQVTASLDWLAGRVELAGRNWSQVRVVVPDQANPKEATHDADPEVTPKSGRPQILAVYLKLTRELLQAGELNYSKRNQQYNRVRQEARKRYPENTALRGVSDETLRKVFLKLGIIKPRSQYQ